MEPRFLLVPFFGLIITLLSNIANSAANRAPTFFFDTFLFSAEAIRFAIPTMTIVFAITELATCHSFLAHSDCLRRIILRIGIVLFILRTIFKFKHYSFAQSLFIRDHFSSRQFSLPFPSSLQLCFVLNLQPILFSHFVYLQYIY